jgi:hypothetical protein
VANIPVSLCKQINDPMARILERVTISRTEKRNFTIFLLGLLYANRYYGKKNLTIFRKVTGNRSVIVSPGIVSPVRMYTGGTMV